MLTEKKGKTGISVEEGVSNEDLESELMYRSDYIRIDASNDNVVEQIRNILANEDIEFVILKEREQ